jgi:hypothetical protein
MTGIGRTFGIERKPGQRQQRSEDSRRNHAVSASQFQMPFSVGGGPSRPRGRRSVRGQPRQAKLQRARGQRQPGPPNRCSYIGWQLVGHPDRPDRPLFWSTAHGRTPPDGAVKLRRCRRPATTCERSRTAGEPDHRRGIRRRLPSRTSMARWCWSVTPTEEPSSPTPPPGLANVKALVYVDAAAPAPGETNGQLSGADSVLAKDTPAQLFRPTTYPNAPRGASDLYLKEDIFISNFGNDLPRSEAERLWAS